MNPRVVVALVSFVAVASVQRSTTAEQKPEALASGVVVERAIREGDVHTFLITVAPGQVVTVAADQLGADVSLGIGLNDTAQATADTSDKHHYGRELLLWVAPAIGTAQLVVRGKSVLSTGGRYRLTPAVLGATESWTAAMAALEEGDRLARGTERAALEQAAQAFQRAAAAWREIGNREMVAACLLRLGRLQVRRLQRPTDAIAPLTEALQTYEALDLPTEMADAIGQIKNALQQTGRQDEAMSLLERSYAHAADLDPINRAIVEDDIAQVSTEMGDFDRAIAFGERAIATFRAAGANRDEAVALERLANTYSRLRRHDDALATIDRAMTLGRQVGTNDDVATRHMLAGRIQVAAGDDDAALIEFQRALDLFSSGALNLINTRVSIARIYNRQGDAARAKEMLEATLGTVPAQVREYWAAVASELGVSLALTGDPARALDLQRRALEIVQPGALRTGELTVLRDLTATYRALGDIANANATIDRMAAIADAMPGRSYGTIVLRERAHNALAAGDLALAQRHLDAALDQIDSVRGRVQSQSLRASFGAAALTYYEDAVDVAMRMHAKSSAQGHDGRAFELFERSRAQSLTDLLAEARFEPGSGVDPALAAEQKALQKQLGEKDTLLRDLAPRPAAKERASALDREIDDIIRRLTVIDGQIRSSNPRLSELTHPAPATLADVQRLLDDQTVLLAFSLGTGSSWGWAIARTEMQSFALPTAARVAEAARRVHADLTARQRRDDRSVSLAEADRRLASDTGALSDLVLGPIAASLSNEWKDKRLAIIATGPLEYIPFAALPVPRGAADPATGATWLVDAHELVQLPSASVLSFLRNDERRSTRPARSVAILADPVYAADDPRVRATVNARRSVADSGAETLLRGTDADGSTRSGFARLVFSRDEARAIAGFAPRGTAFEALDFSASLATIRGPAVAQARIVHIAAHGILNSVRPELSGLALSLVGRDGRPQPGILRLYDVFNLKLSADLVVLSGCQTGLGRHFSAEGLVGLTRAFMYAGAPRVVASLWQVDDLATSELMRWFYQGVLARALTPAAALRAAQRQMRSDPRWQSPFYWAAFTLIGDWQ